jgi:hypothetical protein
MNTIEELAVLQIGNSWGNSHKHIFLVPQFISLFMANIISSVNVQLKSFNHIKGKHSCFVSCGLILGP